MFDRWFDSILVLDDREANQLSTQIEVPTGGTGGAGKQRRRPGGHRKNDSIASTGSSSNSSQLYYDGESVPSSPHNSMDRKVC